MQFTQTQNYPKKSIAYRGTLLALSSIGTALVLGWLLKFSSYGFDFTDESFYLVWISNPFLYDASTTQFGFIYHPLYLLLNGDIANLRRSNIIVTFGLSWILAAVLLRTLIREESTHKPTLLVVAAGLAVSSLVIFDSWLPTPSYNSLALQALLLCSIGLILADKSVSRQSIWGWLLIGMGGWLAFMAKPSTALGLAIGVFLYLILACKFSIRLLLLSIGTALILLVISALWIDGSVYIFIDRLRTGIEFASYLGGGHTLNEIIRLDDFQLNNAENLSIKIFGGVTFGAMWCAYSEKFLGKAVTTTISVFLLAAIVAVMTGFTHKVVEFGRFQDLIFWSLTFAAVAFGLTSLRRSTRQFIHPTHWAIALLFLVMPYFYAFGTNSNYWQAEGAAAIFWILAGVVLLAPLATAQKNWEFVLPMALATPLITGLLLQTGLENPYRQPQPLRLNSHVVELGTPNSNLVLSEETAEYLNNAKKAAHRAGFKSATPVIDLSGQSPGILYALQAKSIAQAWMIGGYPGSKKRLTEALARVSCAQLSDAWILIEPDGPRSLPTDILSTIGFTFPNDFVSVTAWKTSTGAGGYPFKRQQFLFKPTRSKIEAREACLLAQSKYRSRIDRD